MPNTLAQRACPTLMSSFVVRRNSTVPVPDLTAAVRARLPGPPRVEISDDGRFALVAMSSAQLAVCAPDVFKCLAMESLLRREFDCNGSRRTDFVSESSDDWNDVVSMFSSLPMPAGAERELYECFAGLAADKQRVYLKLALWATCVVLWASCGVALWASCVVLWAS